MKQAKNYQFGINSRTKQELQYYFNNCGDRHNFEIINHEKEGNLFLQCRRCGVLSLVKPKLLKKVQV